VLAEGRTAALAFGRLIGMDDRRQSGIPD